jgi:DNA-binding response OmpR family regulator
LASETEPLTPARSPRGGRGPGAPHPNPLPVYGARGPGCRSPQPSLDARGEGAGAAPHPNPLPARGERESGAPGEPEGPALQTILLVEDATDLAGVIARELKGAGYVVVRVADGESVLRQHAALQPDLVILDWMLPGLDGLEVLRRLRARAPTPVLMLTARDDEADRVLGLGADDYITKPFSMRELLARVRALLRRLEHVRRMMADDHHEGPALLRSGTLNAYTEACLATLSGEPLDLSRTEFDLLCLFLRHPGRAFSRDYILDAVWGEEYVTGDRSVDNAVLRLRKKIGSMGDNIETVWGVGYRWRDDT